MFHEYVAHGWKLCAIDKGKKAPTYTQWNTAEKAAEIGLAADALDGAGLLHALSGTAALDIDNLELARKWFLERDVSLDALLTAPDAVMIDSGRHGRAKLLYALKKPLQTVKRDKDGFELRCATAEGKSVQDVLPPSTHPDTKKPYAWKYNEPIVGDWRALPPLPAQVYRIWRELLNDATPVKSPAQETIPSENMLEIFRYRLRTQDPDMPYADWLDKGMQAHTADASEQGPYFNAWLEWSAGGKKFKGKDDLLSHWRSFSSEPGKKLATIEKSLRGAAAPIEFKDAPAAADVTTADLDKAAAQTRRQAAVIALQERLIFVKSIEKYYDLEEQRVLGSHTAVRDLYTYLMPRTRGKNRVDPVKILQENPELTRDVYALGFNPGAGALFDYAGRRYANVFKPQYPQPLEPTQGELERIDWLFSRLEDQAVRTWVLQFLAHIVQRPGVKIRSAPLVWSEIKGNGKSTMLQAIPAKLVGPHYSQDVSCDALVSNFNDYVEGKWHINLTEFRAGTRGERNLVTAKTKQLISESTVSVHPKGRTVYTMPNYLVVTATSNDSDAAQLDNAERRWMVYEMNAPKMDQRDIDYIYRDFLNTDRAPGVLRGYFMGVDLTGFSPDASAPETQSRAKMIEASRALDEEAIIAAFEERSGPFARDIVQATDVAAFVRRSTGTIISLHRTGRILAKPPINGEALRFRCGDGLFRAVIIRNNSRWRLTYGPHIKAHIDGLDIDDVDLLT